MSHLNVEKCQIENIVKIKYYKNMRVDYER